MQKRGRLFFTSIKPFALVVSLALIGAGTVTGQVLINENFSMAIIGTAPAGWLNIDNGATSQIWEFNNPGGRMLDGGFGGQFAIMDSDYYGDGFTQNADLVTPTFDASVPGEYKLEFDNNWEQCCGAIGTVEVWNGTSWTVVMTLPNTNANNGIADPSSHETINITTAAGSSNAAKVRFHYEAEWDYWWAIDNVKITRLNCSAPAATYTIVPDCSNNQFSISVDIPSLGTATSIALKDGTTTLTTVTATGTYTVGPFTAGSSHNLTLEHNIDTLCNVVSPLLVYLCNNECSTATMLPPNITCTPVHANTMGASVSTSSAPSCASESLNDDIWFSFVATQATHFISTSNVSTTPAALNFYYGISAYSGTCSGMLTEIGCDYGFYEFGTEPATLIVNDLTIGETYYIRFWEDGAYDNNLDPITADFNFDICLIGTAPLPLTLSSLSGSLTVGNLAILSWNTFNEEGAGNFDILRSEDGTHFTSAGYVMRNTAHVSNGKADYIFKDERAVTETSYYKIQQTSGSKTISSNIVSLTAAGRQALSLTVFPNPAKSLVHINMPGIHGSNAFIYITDVTGKKVFKLPVNTGDMLVDISDLAKGVYFVKYVDDIQTRTIKMSKQ